MTDALVERNEIADCGWQDAEFHWEEVAAIKLLGARSTLVRNNHIQRMQGGCGIWLDFGIQNLRIDRNLIQEVTTVQGAIFLEASQIENLVDHNLLWNITGQGVRLADTDDAIVAPKLFGNVTEELVAARVATERSLGGRRLTSARNQIRNNIVFNQRKPIEAPDPSNIADYNVYISSSGASTAKDSGEHSIAISGQLEFDRDRLTLSFKYDANIPDVPLLKNCELDFFQQRRRAAQNPPGPFLGMGKRTTFRLGMTRH